LSQFAHVLYKTIFFCYIISKCIYYNSTFHNYAEVTIRKSILVKKKKTPKFLYDKQGNKAGVLLPRKDYDKLMTDVEDHEDYIAATRHAKKLL
jgi:hypothetical protein